MFNKICSVLVFSLIFATLASADPQPIPAGTIPPSDGTAGVVTPDNGLDPNPNPLAPNMPLTPATTYPQQPDGSENSMGGMSQQTVIITPQLNNDQNLTGTTSTVATPTVPTRNTSSVEVAPGLAVPGAPPNTTGGTQPGTGEPAFGSTPPTTTTPTPTATPIQPSNAPYVPGPAAGAANQPMMDKCRVLDKDGNGLIKAYMADSGPNLEGDASAWIWVPHGQCGNINHGDFSSVTALIRSKINPSDVNSAQTIP